MTAAMKSLTLIMSLGIAGIYSAEGASHYSVNSTILNSTTYSHSSAAIIHTPGIKFKAYPSSSLTSATSSTYSKTRRSSVQSDSTSTSIITSTSYGLHGTTAAPASITGTGSYYSSSNSSRHAATTSSAGNWTSNATLNGWFVDGRLYSPQFTPLDDSRSFRESPQCTSDLLSFYNLTSPLVDPREQYTWSVPAGSTITYTIKPTNYNARTFTVAGPTVTSYADSNQAAVDGPAVGCCGVCSLEAFNVDVRYWPQPGANFDCMSTLMKTQDYSREVNTGVAANTGNIPIPYPAGSDAPAVTPRAIYEPTAMYGRRSLVKRNGSIEKDGEVISVDEDGFTYTSPYVYLIYNQVWATDRCGQVGGLYTSLTWSFLPDQLSSVDNNGYTRSFNLTDLPCRPETIYHHDGYYHPATIAAAPQLNLVDPAFKTCWVGYWQGLDPPFAFSTVNNFFATTTEPTSPAPTPPQPESKPASAPLATLSPVTVHFSAPRAKAPANPKENSPSQTQAPQHTVTQLPPKSKPPPPLIVIASHTASFDVSSSALVVGSDTVHVGDPPVTINNTPVFVSFEAPSVAVGSSTFEIPSTPTALPVVVAGHSITQSDGSFVVAGHTLSAGGSAITINHTPISIAPGAGGAATAIVGSSTVAIAPTPAPDPLIIVGQTLTPTTSGNYVVAGKTVTPGGPAITANGVPISIAPSGLKAHIGSSTVNLNPFYAIPRSSFAAGGQTFAFAKHRFVVAGHTLYPGSIAYTVDGTRVSVGAEATPITVTYADGKVSIITPTAPYTTTYANGKVATVTPPEPYLVVGSKTFHIYGTEAAHGAVGTAPAAATTAAVLTLQGAKFTPLPGGSEVVYDGTTLHSGDKFTVHGTVGSVAHEAVVLGLETEPTDGWRKHAKTDESGKATATTTSLNVGDYVFSGIASQGYNTTPAGGQKAVATASGTGPGAEGNANTKSSSASSTRKKISMALLPIAVLFLGFMWP